MDENEIEDLCRAIQARGRHTENLKDAEEETGQTLWWYHLIGRRNRECKIANEKAEKIAQLQSKIDDNEKKITPDGVHHLACIAAVELWKEAARSVIPHKNPYGQTALRQFPGILQMALKERDKLKLNFGYRSRPFTLDDLPDVDTQLTDDFIESNARDNIDEYAAIATSSELVYEDDVNNEGDWEMTIQHLKSGLRAQFTIDKPGFGRVFSKPYVLESIDPKKPGTLNGWEKYTGLGIGGLIYDEAHRREPNVRWVKGLTSEYSTPLRTKLHADNPYIWESRCKWCEDELERLSINSWSHTNKDFFNNHP